MPCSQSIPMIMKRFLPAIPIAVTLLTSFANPFASHPRTVSGKLMGESNTGVSGAYVYIIAGEEETLSVKDGKFSLKTWQPLPFVLVIEHSEFETHKMVIWAEGKPVTIKLSQRKN